MRVDLTLLVPDWLLQYETWRQFLQVLEDSINETLEEVDKLKGVYDVVNLERYFEWDVVVRFLSRLVEQFGIGQLVGVDADRMKVLIGDRRGLIEKKSSEAFFKALFELFGLSFVLRDLSREIIRLSEQGVLSGGYMLQDAMYYRDGSVEVTVPVAYQSLVQQMLRWVSAGVYVWVYVISGVVWSEMETSVSDVGKKDDFAVGVFCFLDTQLVLQVDSSIQGRDLLSSQGVLGDVWGDRFQGFISSEEMKQDSLAVEGVHYFDGRNGITTEVGVSERGTIESDVKVVSYYFVLKLMRGLGGSLVVSV